MMNRRILWQVLRGAQRLDVFQMLPCPQFSLTSHGSPGIAHAGPELPRETCKHSFSSGSRMESQPDPAWRHRQSALEGADAETRTAMTRWRQLLRGIPEGLEVKRKNSFVDPPPLSEISQGAEDGALLLSELHDLTFDGILAVDDAPCEAWSQALRESNDDPRDASCRILDQMASQIRAGNPGVFPTPSPRDGAATNAAEIASIPERPATDLAHWTAAVKAVHMSLFVDDKPFRYEPFEWVYDGLAPLLLPDVLRTRRGIPLSLAIMICSVARRLGLTAIPIFCSSSGSSASDDALAPPEVIAKKAGRALLATPLPDHWLVAFPPLEPFLSTVSTFKGPKAQPSVIASGTLFMDVGRRHATVIDWSRLQAELPQAARSYVRSDHSFISMPLSLCTLAF